MDGRTYPCSGRALAIMVVAQAMADLKEKRYQKEVIRWLESKDCHMICDLAGTTPTEVVRWRNRNDRCGTDAQYKSCVDFVKDDDSATKK